MHPDYALQFIVELAEDDVSVETIQQYKSGWTIESFGVTRTNPSTSLSRNLRYFRRGAGMWPVKIWRTACQAVVMAARRAMPSAAMTRSQAPQLFGSSEAPA